MRVGEIARMTSNARSGVLLSGYFGCGNLGDDLLLSTAVAEQRALMPGAHFLVRDSGQAAQPPMLGHDVEFTGVDAILADQARSRPVRLARFAAATIRLLRRCRWLIFAGGTVFHEQNGAHSLMVQWLICRLARIMGVRIAALGVGVSELHSPRGRWLVRDIVAMSDLFLVRDEASRRQCASDTVRVTDDLVFSWEDIISLKEDRPHNREGRRTIALTVCPGAFPGDAAERAVGAFTDAVRSWQRAGHRVVFLVFHTPRDAAGDRAMFDRINDRLDPGAKVEIRTLTAAPPTLQSAYLGIDAICGMRFHGFVLAALFDVPFVGVAHDHKISEICRRFSMKCLEAGTFDGVALANATAAAMDRRLDTLTVERCIAGSRANFRALAELVR
jgi:polysaccharide pyruvyl transferase WcaK-like protein